MWIWQSLQDFLAKYATTILSFLVIYVLGRSVIASTGKGYWLDELLTQLVTSQGSFGKVMAALHAPIDGQPPLFYVIERLASRLVGNQDIALRLPSALGAACTVVCVYIFLKRRSGRAIALLGSAFLLTAAVSSYAVEARPYSLVLACISFALVCYQRVSSAKWVALLGASLALAQSLHYLALVSMVPFGLAELYGTLRLRRIRWGVWAALAIGVLPVILFWNLIALNKAYYGPHHVALGYNLPFAIHAYGDLLNTEAATGMGIVMVAATGLAMSWRNPQFETDAKEREDRENEYVLIAGLLALPLIAYVFVLATHGPMTLRYFLPAVLGVPLCLGVAIARMPKQALALFAAYVVATAGIAELHFWRSIPRERAELANRRSATVKMVEDAGYPRLPVVVPSGDILWVVRYAFPDSPERFAYLTKDQDGPADTTDKSLTNAQRYVPIQVRRASEFIAANPKFLLFTEGDNAPGQWLMFRMLQERWSVALLGSDGVRSIYLVQNPRGGGGNDGL